MGHSGLEVFGHGVVFHLQKCQCINSRLAEQSISDVLSSKEVQQPKLSVGCRINISQTRRYVVKGMTNSRILRMLFLYSHCHRLRSKLHP